MGSTSWAGSPGRFRACSVTLGRSCQDPTSTICPHHSAATSRPPRALSAPSSPARAGPRRRRSTPDRRNAHRLSRRWYKRSTCEDALRSETTRRGSTATLSGTSRERTNAASSGCAAVRAHAHAAPGPGGGDRQRRQSGGLPQRGPGVGVPSGPGDRGRTTRRRGREDRTASARRDALKPASMLQDAHEENRR